MSDLLFQNLSTVQSEQQPQPVIMPAATTIAPSTFVTFLTGSTAITTVTPPVSGSHMLVLVPTGATPPVLTSTTSGNLAVTLTTAVQNVPVLLFYDNTTAKYYVGGLV